MASPFDLIIYRGDTLTLDVLVTDELTGLPVDLTNWTVHWEVKRFISDAMAAISGDSTDPTKAEVLQPQTAPALKGRFRIYGHAADTQILTAAIYTWGARITSSTDSKTIIPPSLFDLRAGVVP